MTQHASAIPAPSSMVKKGLYALKKTFLKIALHLLSTLFRWGFKTAASEKII